MSIESLIDTFKTFINKNYNENYDNLKNKCGEFHKKFNNIGKKESFRFLVCYYLCSDKVGIPELNKELNELNKELKKLKEEFNTIKNQDVIDAFMTKSEYKMKDSLLKEKGKEKENEKKLIYILHNVEL